METTWIDFWDEHMKNQVEQKRLEKLYCFVIQDIIKVHKPQWAITSHLIEWSWSKKYGILNIGNNIE